MMPAAPLVGAVTTRPPAAFCSLTASAYSVTHSIAYSGSVTSDVRSSLSRRLRARLRTLSPPGSTPPASQPAATQSRMTDQIRSTPHLIAASSLLARGRDPPHPPPGRTSPLASVTPLIGRP